MPEANYKCLTSEFLGTFLLVFTVGCNTVIGASGQWAALSIASVLMVSIYALGSVSGAMFNPAVALAVFMDGKFPEFTGGAMAMYMVVQFLGGIAAALLSLWVHGNAMNLEPGAGYSYGGAAFIEITYTFMLCFVVLKAAVHAPADREYFGLAIGFVIVAGGYAGGFISKGAFNPAVALGVDVGSAGQGVYWCFLYMVWEFIGAGLAWACHKGTSFVGTKAPLAQRLFAEFLGTFYLVFTVGLNVLGGSPMPALSIAASLMCMVYTFGDVSGAAFNPAVSFAATLFGAASALDLVPYWLAQLFGGLVAGIMYTMLLDKSIPLGPGEGFGWTEAVYSEILFTFVLCFVVLNVACQPAGLLMSKGGKSTQIYGLAIGFCIVAGGYSIGAVSGGSLNPAVSFGLDASHAIKSKSYGAFGNCLNYSFVELIGAFMAYGLTVGVRSASEKAGFLSAKDTYGSMP